MSSGSLFPYWNPYWVPRQPLFIPDLLGELQLVTPPTNAVFAVSPDEAMVHCRVDLPEEQKVLERLIRMATKYCEQEIPGHRQFLTATYKVPIKCWWTGPLKLPRPPLQSIGAITYYDTGGSVQTLDSSIYLVNVPQRGPGTIERAPFQVFPPYQWDRRYPVFCQFTAGYGNSPNSIPETIRQAILMVVEFFYKNRGISELPDPLRNSVQALLLSENYGSYA